MLTLHVGNYKNKLINQGGKKHAKKIISIMLTLVMLVSLLPAGLTVSAATLAESMIFQLEFNGGDNPSRTYVWECDNDGTDVTLTPSGGVAVLDGATFTNASGVKRQPKLTFGEAISLSGKTDTVLEVRMKIELASGATGTVSATKQLLSLVENVNYHASAWGVSGMHANGGVGANGERIIAESTIRLMRENQLNEKQLETFNWSQLKGYGYGLGVRTLIDKAAAGSTGPLKEFGWGGAAGATVLCDLDAKVSMFYSHHMLNPQETYYQPRLRNVLYTCINS